MRIGGQKQQAHKFCVFIILSICCSSFFWIADGAAFVIQDAPAASREALEPYDDDVLWARLGESPADARTMAMRYIDREIPVSEADYARALNIVAISHAMEGRLKEALPYSERVYAGWAALENYSRMAGAMSNIANMHRQMGNLPDAIASFKLAIAHAKEAGAASPRAAALINLADMLRLNGATRQAMPLYKEADRLIDDIENPAFMAGGFISMAGAQLEMDDLDGARKSLAKAYDLFGGELGVQEKSDYLAAEARIQLGENDLEAAKSSADECIAIAAEHNLQLSLRECEFIAAKVALAQKDLSRADALMRSLAQEKVLAEDEDNPAALQNRRSYLLLQSRLQKEQGDFSAALQNRERADEMRERLAEFRQDAELALAAADFTNEARDLRMELLHEKARFTELEVNRRRLITIGSSLAALVFIMLSGVLFYSFSRANSDRQALALALGERNMLMRELHHRVKNSLQIIASMINLQKRKAASKQSYEAVNALGDIQGRVGAMSDIQKSLFEIEGAFQVPFKIFVTDLANRLCEASGGEIAAKVDVDEVNFPASIAAPLGLIVNELANNAIKHAFRGSERSPEFFIELSAISSGSYRLEISDNGSGFDPAIAGEGNTLGFSFVHDLTRQIDGKISLQSGPEGTVWTIDFPGDGATAS